MVRGKLCKLSMVGLVLVLLLSFSAYGCASTSSSPTAAPQPTSKPAAAPAATPASASSSTSTSPSTSAKPSGEPVKVGYMTPLSGRAATYGIQQQVAVKLALEDINTSGGINGAPLEIVNFDSPFDPQQAISGVRKLAQQDKVFAIVGPYSSGELEVAGPIAKDLQIPLISASGNKPGIMSAMRPWGFRHVELEANVAPVSLDAFKKVYPNVKKMVIAGDVKESVNENITRVIWPGVLKDKGYELVDIVTFEAGQTDFSATVTKIKGLNPDGIAVVGLLPEAVGLAKELDRQAVKVPVITGTQIEGVPFIGTAGAAVVEGWVGGRHSYLENPDPNFQKFASRFNDAVKAANIKIDQISLEPGAYDAFMMIADIMRKNNITAKTDLQQARTTIRDGLNNLKDWKSMYGPVSMSSDGETHWKTYPHVAKNGKWELIK